MPQDKRYRSGSAAAGGGMLTLWLTMRANAWLRQEWLSLLTETAAEGIGLVLHPRGALSRGTKLRRP